ncbi:MAG: CapA family protein [Flavisolibacter sp.]
MDKPKLILHFMGDIMIGRNVDSVITEKGYAYPWGNTLSRLLDGDINIINLETTLTNSRDKVAKVFNFKAGPDRIQTLLKGHITVVNLANNHILDYGEKGLLETLSQLDAYDILHTGAGSNEEEAARPVIIKREACRIGVLGFTDNEPSWKASANRCGTNYLDVSRTDDRERARQKVKQLSSEADLIVVSLHWGPNLRQRPCSLFVRFAHDLVDSGARIIFGHSAHIFQAIELYHDGLILYDTGDYIDDYQVDPVLRNDLSFLYEIECCANDLKRLQLYPVQIRECQVNFVNDDSYAWSMDRICKLSAFLNTSLQNGKLLLT